MALWPRNTHTISYRSDKDLLLAIFLGLRTMPRGNRKDNLMEEMAARFRLNPATVQAIHKTGDRQKALQVLDSMVSHTHNPEKIRQCLFYGAEFEGGHLQDRSYFPYLQRTRQLIDELYPPETRS